MIKGCSRKMIVLKDTGSDLFEEAYFVLKSRPTYCKIKTERDFIAEANRVVAESVGSADNFENKHSRNKKAGAFLGGLFCGIAASAAFIMLLRLFCT